jgi:hypothetical protein
MLLSRVMRVRELIEKLRQFDPEEDVVLLGHEYADAELDLETVELIDEQRRGRLGRGTVHFRAVRLSA